MTKRACSTEGGELTVIVHSGAPFATSPQGLVAQGLEHSLDKRGVASSNLARPTLRPGYCHGNGWARCRHLLKQRGFSALGRARPRTNGALAPKTEIARAITSGRARVNLTGL
jgi:hypothetical protein